MKRDKKTNKKTPEINRKDFHKLISKASQPIKKSEKGKS